MVANIKRSLTSIEREEMESQRMLELLGSSRSRFKTILTDLEEINEQSWSDESIRVELARALGVIEDARVEYNKTIAKIEAAKSERTGGRSESAVAPVVFDDASSEFAGDKSFMQWFKMGAAFSLPLIITLAVIAAIYLILASYGYL
jgi:hypothetical protein